MPLLPKFGESTAQIVPTIDLRDVAALLGWPDRPTLNPGGLVAGVSTTPQIVADVGASLAEVVQPVIGGTPGALTLVSSDAADSGGGVLALVHYVDGNGWYRQAFVPLDGTTPVAAVDSATGQVVTAALRVNHMLVINAADPDASNAGRVDARITISATPEVQVTVPIGRGWANGAMFSVPRGYKCSIAGFDAQAVGAACRVSLQVRLVGDGPGVAPQDTSQFGWITPKTILVGDGANARWAFDIPFDLDALADCRLMAETVSGTAEVSGQIQSYIVYDGTVDKDPHVDRQPERD